MKQSIREIKIEDLLAVLILEIVDRALRDRMLAQGLPVGQKTDDAVMRRVLKTRDQRHRLVPRAVDQNLTSRSA